MNRQMSFSESEFSSKKRVTPKEAFLAVMEKVVPWRAIIDRVEPFYPKGKRGRPPKGLERIRSVSYSFPEQIASVPVTILIPTACSQ